MSQRVEYRVRWKRKGRQQATVIRQRWGSAWRKAEGILALEAVKADTRFSAMPDLEEGPVIEERPVGDWAPTAGQISAPSKGARDAMFAWVDFTRPSDDRDGEDVPF
jgi:hypothetical protein